MASRDIMSPQIRQTLNNISSRIFNPQTASSEYEGIRDILPGNEICTSLPLQMAMYFNLFFFPFWIISCSLMLDIKYEYLENTYKVLLIAILIVFSLVEIIRLYLGYIGNLQEKVPELAGFLLLTFVPQLPLTLFLLLNEFTIILPLERIMHIILLLLVLIEIVFAWVTASKMTKQQSTKFHLQQFVDVEHIDPNDPNSRKNY